MSAKQQVFSLWLLSHFFLLLGWCLYLQSAVPVLLATVIGLVLSAPLIPLAGWALGWMAARRGSAVLLVGLWFGAGALLICLLISRITKIFGIALLPIYPILPLLASGLAFAFRFPLLTRFVAQSSNRRAPYEAHPFAAYEALVAARSSSTSKTISV